MLGCWLVYALFFTNTVCRLVYEHLWPWRIVFPRDIHLFVFISCTFFPICLSSASIVPPLGAPVVSGDYAVSRPKHCALRG